MATALTAGQREIWLAQCLSPDSAIYKIGETLLLPPDLDVARFEAALRLTLQETDALKMRLATDRAGNPVQVSGGAEELRLDIVRPPATQAKIDEAIATALRQPLAIDGAPLCAFALFTRDDGAYVFRQTFHHVLMDGFSCALFGARIAEQYDSLTRTDRPLPRAFGDLDALIEDDRAYAQSAAAETDAQFWRAQLASLPEKAQVRRPAAAYDALRRTERLPATLVAALRNVARSAGASFVHLLGAAALAHDSLAARSWDATLGFVVAGRPNETTHSIPGVMSNIVPLRIALRPSMSWVEAIVATRTAIERARPHQRRRLEDIRRDLSLADGDHRLTSTVLNYIPFYTPLRFDRTSTTLRNIANGPVDDLAIVAYPSPDDDGLLLDFNANGSIRNRSELDRFARGYIRILEQISADSADRIAAVDLLSSDEHARFLAGSAAAMPVVPATLPALFTAAVAGHPDAPALTCGPVTLSYRELECRAQAMARRIRTKGVRAEDRVALALRRSDQLVVSLLGIAMVGAAYVALDLESPAARLGKVLEDAVPTLLVTSSRDIDLVVAAGWRGTVLLVEDDARGGEASGTEVTPHPENAAYVCYTSGSTGVPKGVVVTHANVAALVRDGRLRTRTGTRVLMHSPVSFDASTYEVWATLLGGAELVVADVERLDPIGLGDLLRHRRITDLWLTAGLFDLVADDNLAAFASLDRLIAGGDALPIDSVRKVLRAHPHLVFLNGYGPTETTTFAAMHAIAPDDARRDAVPIGTALDGGRAYVLDHRLHPVAEGVIGDLHLAGAGLARGYLGKPDQTAERFVANPFGAPGERLYRTGDLAAWTPEGVLTFHGRADSQVKLRGFRIELREIEIALADLGLPRATVIVRKDGARRDRLVAYVVGASCETRTIRAQLFERLPSYMVPAAIVRLDDMPLTGNGKVDRRQLPEPRFDNTGEDAAQGATEALIAGLFAEVLGLPSVGREDNFFDDLGGNSLLALRITGKLRQDHGFTVDARAMFVAPTVASLAARFDGGRTSVRPRAVSSDAAIFDLARVEETLRERFANETPDAKAFVATVDSSGVEQLLFSRGSLAPNADRVTAFSLGSISKLLVSILLVRMEEAGLVSIADTLADRFPDHWHVPDTFGTIDMADLATHTSGLPAYVETLEQASEEQLRGYIEAFDQVVSRRSYEYCTLGIALLGFALRRSQDIDYLDLLDRFVLGPLEMKRTGSRMRGASAMDTGPLRFYECGAEMESSIADLRNMMIGFVGEGPVSLAPTLRRMLSVPRPTGMPDLEMTIGLRSRTSHGAHLLYHGGGGPGYRAFFGFAPLLRKGIVILTDREIHIGDIGQHWLCSAYPLAATRDAVKRSSGSRIGTNKPF